MNLAIKEQDDRSLSSRANDPNPVLPDKLHEYDKVIQKGCFIAREY